MELRISDKVFKTIVLFSSGIVLSYCAYASYKYWRKRQFRSIDEGFEDVSKIEENTERRILVLGLENSGKSTILSQINSKSAVNCRDLKPTEGFNVTTMESNGISLNIWEIGGKENVRLFWPNFLQDTDILVFVVDASDLHNLSLAVKEVKWLLADNRLSNVPVLLIANKQDKPNAMAPEQVADALDMSSVPPTKHKIKVIGTQTPPGSKERHQSISDVERHLLLLLND